MPRGSPPHYFVYIAFFEFICTSRCRESLTGLRATWPPALEASPTRSTRWGASSLMREVLSQLPSVRPLSLGSRSRRPLTSTTSVLFSTFLGQQP